MLKIDRLHVLIYQIVPIRPDKMRQKSQNRALFNFLQKLTLQSFDTIAKIGHRRQLSTWRLDFCVTSLSKHPLWR